MSDTPETLTVTVPEYAKTMRTGESTVYAAIQRGEIPAIHVGRAVRIPRWHLDQLLQPTAAA